MTNASIVDKWFNFDIPLNPELVAVIGNKGSGKSALSDIIGLLGGTPRYASFSFLNQERFRKQRDNKARHFHAILNWADGTKETVPTLDVVPGADAVEKIKYIPQNYLEEICNEIGSGTSGRFYAELQQVIFSHVPIPERLRFGTLDELLSHRSEETNQAISQIIHELRDLNVTVVAIEDRLAPSNKKAIEAQLVEKKRELEAHHQSKPLEVLKPDADVATLKQSQQVADELDATQTRLSEIESQLSHLSASDAAAALKGSTAEKVLGKIRNFKRQYDAFLVDAAGEFAEIGIDPKKAVELRIDTTGIESLVSALAAVRQEIESKCDPAVAGSPAAYKKSTVAAIDALQVKLSAPQRAYQLYLKSLKAWEATRDGIIGEDLSVGSIKNLEKQLRDLDVLPARLDQLRVEQEQKLSDIYSQKQKLRDYYESYYGSVQRFLKQHPLAAGEQFQLTFNVSILENGFADGSLGRLNRRKVGAFMGDAEGAAEMRKLLDSATFESRMVPCTSHGRSSICFERLVERHFP